MKNLKSNIFLDVIMLKKDLKMIGKINKLIDKVDSTVEDEDFKNKIKAILLFVRGYENFYVEKNQLKGFLDTEDGKYTLEVNVMDDNIQFKTMTKNKMLTGSYFKDEEGKVNIEYLDKDITIFENLKSGCENINYDSYNVCTRKSVDYYDKFGVQLYKYEEEVQDNYYLNKPTGVKLLHEPDCMENYTKKEYTWRAPEDSIIKRTTCQYVYPVTEDCFIPLRNEDAYLIGRNICPDDKKLPYGGNYTWFCSELYNDYISGVCDINQVWSDRESRYQKRLQVKE